MNHKILTIDGASGVGKGTIAKIIAKKNNWNLLDSGSIYRAFAIKIGDNNCSDEFLENSAKNLNLEFIEGQILLDGNDVSKIIRTEKVGNAASKFAKLGFVRAALLQKQRDFATEKGLVADGRDMATVVFPEAAYQVFLTASVEIRAKRRLNQLQLDKKSSKIDNLFQEIVESIGERDARDKNRKNSPLIPSEKALIIDTGKLSIEQVVVKITNIMML